MATTNKRTAPDAAPTAGSPAPAKKARQSTSLTEPHAIAGDIKARMTAAWELDEGGKRAYLGYTHAWMYTENFNETVEFYVRKLGFQLTFRWKDEWAELRGPGGVMLGFQPRAGFNAVDKTGPCICIGTLDHDKSAATLRARGVEVSDVMCNGPVAMRSFKDNNGYQMVMVTYWSPDMHKAGADGEASAAAKPAGDEAKADEAKKANPHTTPWTEDAELAWADYSNIKFNVKDVDATAKFYAALGFVERERFGNMWLEVEAPGGVHIGFKSADSSTAAPQDVFMLGVGSNNLSKSRNAAIADGVLGFPALWTKDPSGHMTMLPTTDPDGNAVALVAKPTELGDLTETHPDVTALLPTYMKPWGAPEVGYLSFTNVWLWCKSMEATAAFYVRKLGWKLAARYDDMWLELMGPGGVLLGFQQYEKDATVTKPSGFSIGIGTLDMAKSVAALKARGVTTFADAAVDKGMVELWSFTDPDDHTVTLIGTGSAAASFDPAMAGSGAGAGAGTGAGAGAEEKHDGGEDWNSMMTLWPNSDPELAFNSYGNVTLKCAKISETQAWYSEKLSAKTAARYGDMWLEMEVPGGLRLGFEQDDSGTGESAVPAAGYDIGMGVANLSATGAVLKGRGVSLESETPRMVPCVLQRFTDPVGNRLMLVMHDDTNPDKPKDADGAKAETDAKTDAATA